MRPAKQKVPQICLVVVIALAVLLLTTSSRAFDIIYLCQAAPKEVFHVVTEQAEHISSWRSIHVAGQHRTLKAMVRNWRNFSVPVWIQVRPTTTTNSTYSSEVHLLYEQSMEPLNHPDLFAFTESFQSVQQQLGLGCRWTGTDIGL